MRRTLRRLAIVSVAAAAVAVAGFYAWTQSRTARPAAAALAALEPADDVVVEQDRFLSFRPTAGQPRLGMIFYPGANSDVRGYAPTLRRIAAAGFLVVGVPMPLGMAIFAPDRATDVRAAFPDIETWVIAGHSMGGAMAGAYGPAHQDELAGIVIWDSYPLESAGMATTDLPVWHVHRATPDGLPPPKFQAKASHFPADAVWVPVPGGNHMNFGAFDGGGYVEEWEAKIPQAAQHDLVVAATVDALRSIEGRTQASRQR